MRVIYLFISIIVIITFRNVRKVYISTLDIDLPDNLKSFDFINKILNELYDKTKFNILRIKEYFSFPENYKDENIQIIAEYMTFDYINKEYNLEKIQIEKALQLYNIKFN